MNVFENDLLITQQKLDGTFTFYTTPDIDLNEFNELSEKSRNLNTKIQLGRFISHSTGRLRADKILKKTRLDIYADYIQHISDQQKMYTNLQNVFSNVGVI